ncbi:hypothetical protein [Lactobacillus intestinalis]|uniref:hypothetical protein n=1 Tax=Lactobacillus intestinalis TaxID=151781 RepID=UPI002624DFE6|nr:hypothetical protein [Lactobacillus intestinalis]
MTSFGTLFRQLFLQKSRSAYLIFGIQFLAAFVLTILTLGSAGLNNPKIDQTAINTVAGAFLTFIVLFLMLCFLTAPVYLVMTSWKNEKINRDQTWRLIPISSGKFYLSNTLSSFAAYIYLEIMQLVLMLVGFFGMYLASSEVRKGVSEVIAEATNNNADYGMLVEYLIIGLLLNLFWYVMISFYHFLSRSVIDFLPTASNRFVIFIIRVLVLVVVIYALYFVSIGLSDLFIHPLTDPGESFELLMTIVIFILFNVIFGGLNVLLINKFVEAKTDR